MEWKEETDTQPGVFRLDLLREFIALLRPKNLVFLYQLSSPSFRFNGCIVTQRQPRSQRLSSYRPLLARPRGR